MLINNNDDEKTFSWTNQKLVIWMKDIQICEKVLFFFPFSFSIHRSVMPSMARRFECETKELWSKKKINKERMNEREKKERKSERLHLKSIWRASQSFWRHRAKFLESLSNNFSINQIFFVKISKNTTPTPQFDSESGEN